ncbi:SMP-30/gluconolactonase/LRE family protein [Polycladidibacter stylochi]|uniref:SMP-30/gluconolactonase/LRE family protein n=1 Tax=Polycladidibacter stylochi TaxID=1807766 RepID=UPI00082F9B4F|nr:SMP-30/gluconolactonase/LRE family protein [Pseudovibrio stylochi]
MTPVITCLHDGRYELAEGAVWDDKTASLYFCDILGRHIYALDWESQAIQSYAFPKKVGSFGLCKDGRLVVAMQDEIILFDMTTKFYDQIASIEGDDNRTRLNDGKVGPDGAFWVGTMDDRSPREPISGLYRVTIDGTVTKVVSDLHCTNGIAWSPDAKVMYHSDTSPGWVDAYDFDAKTGQISNQRRFLQLDNTVGRPDGGTVDAKGNYWSAGVSAGNLNCFSSEGELLQSIPLPIPRPTMPCFAGPDLTTLVITSLRPPNAPELLEQFPKSGSLFAMQTQTKGLPTYRFGS